MDIRELVAVDTGDRHTSIGLPFDFPVDGPGFGAASPLRDQSHLRIGVHGPALTLMHINGII